MSHEQKRISQPSAIILTSGLTGSSVLTALIAQAGYWTGEITHKKADYDTHENQKLIELNLKLFMEAGYEGNYLLEFSPEAIQRISRLQSDIPTYRAFIEECDRHRPWVWKDPRLWLTIRFWKNLLTLEDCRFILLTRDYLASWVSTTLRGQIRSYQSLKQYEEYIQGSILDFLKETAQPFLHLRYEELILRPAETIEQLNRFIQTSLTLDDLKKVYKKPLYKTPNGSYYDYTRAVLMYLKNYSERHGPDRVRQK